MTDFTYIVTIHNGEHCLQGTLDNLIANSSAQSNIIAILDGCSDRSEQIVDGVNSNIPYPGIIKLYAPDVHEIKSLNLGFQYVIDHNLSEYVFTVQNDLWQLDPNFEPLTKHMFNTFPRLRHLTYRLGFNATPDLQFIDMCENYSSPTGFGTTLGLHEYAKRMVCCKTPSCIPVSFLKEYGLLDENLCPRGYDDVEISLRALSLGFDNMVLATKWRSDLDWGQTRRTIQNVACQDEHNNRYVQNKYKDLLSSFQITSDYREVNNIG